MKKHNTTSPPRLAALMKPLVKLLSIGLRRKETASKPLLIANPLSHATTIAKSLVMLAGAALLGLVSQSALAAGTASGTSISNSATLAYSVTGVAQTGITSAAATFLVDNKVNLTVVKVDATAVSVVSGPSATTGITTFTVTNNGNTSQDFSLAAVDMATLTANPFGGLLTDSFVASACTVSNIVIATGAMGTYTAADQHINALTPDSKATVSVTCTIPASQANNTLAVVSLTATAFADNAAISLGAALVNSIGVADIPGTVQNVFADAAGPAAGDTANHGEHSALSAYLVQTALLTVTKSVAVVCDPINGNSTPKNIPGAAVQYAITISNALGAASATLATLADTLQSTVLAFDPNLNSGALPAANCVSGNGTNTFSASGFGAVYGTGTTTSSYAAPGLLVQAVTAGTGVAGQTVTITYGSLTGGGLGAFAGSGGVLPANSFITVYFNAFVQ